jgi:hypothetical protein
VGVGGVGLLQPAISKPAISMNRIHRSLLAIVAAPIQ